LRATGLEVSWRRANSEEKRIHAISQKLASASEGGESCQARQADVAELEDGSLYLIAI